MFAVLYPSISTPPAFDGPLLIHNVSFGTFTDLTDFYFVCKIQYKRVSDDDSAMFDVALTFDGEVDETTMKTTTSFEKTVVFTSADLRGHFGTKVSATTCCYQRHLGCAVSSLLSRKQFSGRIKLAEDDFV